MAQALSPQWPVLTGEACLTRSCYFTCPFILFSESLVLKRTVESRFSTPWLHGGNPASKVQARWLLIESQKAASGVHPPPVL